MYVEMPAAGTSYAESTILQSTRPMKEPGTGPPYTLVERVGNWGIWSPGRAELTSAQIDAGGYRIPRKRNQ